MSLCLYFIASLVMHSVRWLSHRKSCTSPNSIPKPLYLFCTLYSLNTTYFRSFISSLAWFYFKIQIVFMQEREEFRALKREGKVKRKICVWENERERLKKKKRKRKKEEWQERYEVDESRERWIKCKEGCRVVERRNFHSFSNHVQSDNEDVIGAS
jgi:hypothetical protein